MEQHHNPEGMIALCGEHHGKADAGAFTTEQLRALKTRRADIVQGTFDWRRQTLLAIVGGNLYFETPRIVVFKGSPLIWFERDEHNNLLLSARMLSSSDEPRVWLDANDWHLEGSPTDFESPPNGRRIRVRYGNGDALMVEFQSIADPKEAGDLYPHFQTEHWKELPFPLTGVELQMEVGGSGILFGPAATKFGGIHMTGGLTKNCGAGLAIQ